MKKQETLRDIVASVVERSRHKGGRPTVSISTLAIACGISRQHLYNLMNGAQAASDWVLDGLVRGLGVPERRIKAALK